MDVYMCVYVCMYGWMDGSMDGWVYVQGLIEKNSLGVRNVNMCTTRYILGNYTLYRLLTFRSKLDINLLFCFRLQY